MSSRPDISEKIKTRLWVLSGGRCQYEGCNEPLWRDDLTMAQMNGAYIAHIVDVNPQTHRYDPVISPKLATAISNLMLLCDKHHRLIDHEGEREHTVDRLTRMKLQHEERIELLTSLKEDKKSHILMYGANIGEQSAPLSYQKAFHAMVPFRYPAEPRAIELSLRNSSFEDDSETYWAIERQNLRNNFNAALRPRIVSRDVEHLSIFALAPQPLLIELGRLLSDIPAAEVYQLHREPPDWKWQEGLNGLDFVIEEPAEICPTVALNLSLSATIENTRINAALPGKALSTWVMTVPKPDRDIMMSKEHLSLFRQNFRRLLDRIKARHGQDILLHVFPAVPVSVAIEIGRVWMPKADLPLCIYDQNRKLGGFSKAFSFTDDGDGEVYRAK